MVLITILLLPRVTIYSVSVLLLHDLDDFSVLNVLHRIATINGCISRLVTLGSSLIVQRDGLLFLIEWRILLN